MLFRCIFDKTVHYFSAGTRTEIKCIYISKFLTTYAYFALYLQFSQNFMVENNLLLLTVYFIWQNKTLLYIIRIVVNINNSFI